MATKRTTRPLRPDPNWANDTNMNDPGEPWDATPTKVEPGIGKRDDGFLPNEKPPAAHVNHLHNEAGLWLQFLSDIQQQNWDQPVETVDGLIPTGQVLGLAYDRGSQRWIAGSINTEILSSPDGYNWTDISPGAGASSFSVIASKPATDAPTHTGDFFVCTSGNATGEIQDRQNGVWANRTLPGTTPNGNDAVWDPSNGLWLVAGSYTGPLIPYMWWADPAVMTWTAVALPVVLSDTGGLIATNGAGVSVIMGAGGAPNDIWRSTDGKIWSAAATLAQTGRALSYDSDRGVFVLLTDTITYTSSDGITWNSVGNISPGGNFKSGPQALVIAGGVWLALVDAASPELRYSTNGGGTWRQLFLQANVSAANYDSLAYSPHHGQFMALQGDSAGNTGHVNKSLSVGTISISAAGGELAPST